MARSIDDMREQGFAGQRVQDLGQVGLHAFSHAGSEDDNVHRRVLGRCKILARTLSAAVPEGR